MRIVETSPERLIIEHRPIFFAGFLWLAGGAALWAAFDPQRGEGWAERLLLVFLGAGSCIAAAVFFPFVRIVLDRNAGTVTRRRGHVDRARVLTVPLADVARVFRQSERNSKGVRLWRLTLEMTDGTIVPLETGFSTGDRTALEAAVNDWMNAPQR